MADVHRRAPVTDGLQAVRREAGDDRGDAAAVAELDAGRWLQKDATGGAVPMSQNLPIELASRVEWVADSMDMLIPRFIDMPEESIAWSPFPGSQQAFLECPLQECLMTGTRGGGKTETLIVDFLQDVGKGFGTRWRGILFREQATQLTDVIAKAERLIPRVFPDAKFNKATSTWVFVTGEQLLFRHARTLSDYWKYHGHEYAWIGWEELTNWATADLFLKMASTQRAVDPSMRVRIRATCNPSGVGHSWVKARYRLSGIPTQMIGEVIADDVIYTSNVDDLDLRAVKAPPRVAIHSDVKENLALAHADPGYIDRIMANASSDAEREAWGRGNWDITAGAYFSEFWRAPVHILPSFPAWHNGRSVIPKGWHLDRSMDWGQARPWSVGFWLTSNGEPIVWRQLDTQGVWQERVIGDVRGDKIRFDEIYGWQKDKPNVGRRATAKEVAIEIKEWADDMGVAHRLKPGPADTQIWTKEERDRSVAKRMAKEGIKWLKADKAPGSRVAGWQLMIEYLKGAIPDKRTGARENPGLFVCRRCSQFIRTVPNLKRDEKNLDEIEDGQEDHIADETRYELRSSRRGLQRGRI